MEIIYILCQTKIKLNRLGVDELLSVKKEEMIELGLKQIIKKLDPESKRIFLHFRR